MSLVQLQDSIDELTIEELDALVGIMRGETQRRVDNFWLTIYQKNTIFVGGQGTGKSASMVMAAHEIHRLTLNRKRTGPGVTTVGPRVGLRKAFGSYQELEYDGFGEQLLRINEAALSPEGRNPEATEDDLIRLYQRYGVTIYGNIVLSDEGYNLFSKRRVMAKENQAFSEFGQTMRHVKLTFMIASPRGELDLDDKVVNQLHYIGRPSIKIIGKSEDGEDEKWCQLYFHKAGTYDALRKVAYGSQRVVQKFPISAVKDLYRTDMPIAISERALSAFRPKEAKT